MILLGHSQNDDQVWRFRSAGMVTPVCSLVEYLPDGAGRPSAGTCRYSTPSVTHIRMHTSEVIGRKGLRS